MSKNQPASHRPSCGCTRCRCQRDLRCRCHDLNALLALALWDYGRTIHRQKAAR